VKIIQKDKLDENTMKMVYREVNIMKLLNHPNIIRLYEVLDTKRFLFLIMEYASGGEVLDYVVAHGRLQEREAKRFFVQIAAALRYCHSLHVVHRDLKVSAGPIRTFPFGVLRVILVCCVCLCLFSLCLSISLYLSLSSSIAHQSLSLSLSVCLSVCLSYFHARVCRLRIYFLIRSVTSRSSILASATVSHPVC
jgi:serine/threonine protein kinase